MSNTMTIHVTVNGSEMGAEVDSRSLLVEAVRDNFGLKGTRIGCETGDCGACTLWLDGKLVKSCLVLAAAAEGRSLTTIEGCHDQADLKSAFVNGNAFQCGFCTTGMFLAAADLLNKRQHPADAEIEEAIAGNLCRCGCYGDIVNAIRQAAQTPRDVAAVDRQMLSSDTNNELPNKRS